MSQKEQFPQIPTSEQARARGKLGKAASPWSRQPACCTPKAAASFKKHNRLELIRAAAKKRQTP